MDAINDFLDSLSDTLWVTIVLPILHGIDMCLGVLFSPLASLAPLYQIMAAAVLGAVVSRILSRRYRSRRERQLQQEFDDKLAVIKEAKGLRNAKVQRVLRKGLQDEADETYEKLILDRFIEMGISYSIPLFSLLIWLEYSRFTPQKLESLTGSPYAWVTAGGLNLSAAYVYFFFFNMFLILFWLLEKQYRKRYQRPASPHEG